ncbi:MAG: helix-turn-helix transcriptional regulator [Gemmatimonadaceae bacterium]
MTNEERDCPMWDGEALAETLGRQLARRDDPEADVWSDESFLEWLTNDLRAAAEQRARSRWDGERLRRSGHALRVRLLARQSGVGLVEAPPRLVAPLRRATPTQVMEEAMAVGAVARVDLAAAAGAGRELWDEPAEHWVALPSGAPRMRALALRIDGESMAPLLHSRDTVLVELRSTFVRGSIVVARHANADDGYVCKRVERIGKREVVLGSINPEFGPVAIPRDERLVVGVVRLVWRG